MRVAIVNTLYPPTTVGGAERSVAVLAEALANSGDDVHVIALDDTDVVSTQRVNGVTVHRLPHENLYWPFAQHRAGPLRRVGWHLKDRGAAPAMRAVRALVTKIEPDVLHTNNLTGFGAGVISMAGDLDLPVVHTLRDFSLLCPRASLFRAGQDCMARCHPCRMLTGPRMKAAQKVQVVIGNSDYMIDRHRRAGLFTQSEARTIYNAVPCTGGAKPNSGTRPAAPFRIGFLGAIKPEKGIEYLLHACRMLPARGWSLTVAGHGDGEYVARLKERYGDMPIEWAGFVGAEQVYDAVDLVVIPSIWPEPMPRVLIEAMARGLPVIVSDAGGAPEVARHYAGAAIYARRDVAMLGKLLKEAVRNRPVRNPPDKDVAERFGTARLVTEYREAYRAAIAQVGHG
ncbi:glycosyltransferase family 4 protein [Croceicoccus sediminis]|uniref:glycosyltransferase family 4 protein n=1 Tax=Croceicoccus sediminis TaxID=2571150 RepID=UPI0011826093|nr:glycosyltransferase family 4 protein [Croceicoccus sediminis]